MKPTIFCSAILLLNAFCQSSPDKAPQIIEYSEQKVSGQRVIIQRIVAPSTTDPAPRRVNAGKQGKSVENIERQKDQLPQTIFIVSTTIYDDKIFSYQVVADGSRKFRILGVLVKY
jgi:hypothetical protein